MKYWRGYLAAVILGAISWGLHWFASGHRELMDMVYPYVTRLVMTTLAEWSAGVSFCLWQLILFLLIAGIVAAIAIAIWKRWSVIRVVGWCLAVISLFYLLDTGIYGLNNYVGPISEDIQLTITGYTVKDLEETTKFFQDKANELAPQINRNSKGDAEYSDFDTLAEQASDGFKVLTYEKGWSVFAGSTAPAKKMGWPYTMFFRGGVMVALTSEVTVNPNVDDISLPFLMCMQTATRMSIVKDVDASVAAFLACMENESPEFRYSAYFMAYRYCYQELEKVADVSALSQSVSAQLAHDMKNFDDSGIPEFEVTKLAAAREATEGEYGSITDCLVSWYIQEYIVPFQREEEVKFDPLDESQVDLSGLVNAK